MNAVMQFLQTTFGPLVLIFTVRTWRPWASK